MQTLYECHKRRTKYEIATHLDPGADCGPGEDAGSGDDEPILAGKRVLEMELERRQKQLNGPQNTANHIEA